jgi:carbon-monoxide dehydrogenase small subunit
MSELTAPIAFTLNGRTVRFTGPASTPLLTVLRETCGDTSVKLGCSRAVCGSCTILLDDQPGAACALFAYQADGRALLTAAGRTPRLQAIADAFAEHAAFQCGYCTSGMILLTKALLDHDPDPDRETVVQWISSNICRCTGYAMIIEAVLAAVASMKESGNA